MTQDELDDLMAKIHAQPDLLEKFRSISNEADFLQAARDAGYDLSLDMPGQDLDDDELEEVSGGARSSSPVRKIDWCRILSGPTCTYMTSTNTVGTGC